MKALIVLSAFFGLSVAPAMAECSFHKMTMASASAQEEQTTASREPVVSETVQASLAQKPEAPAEEPAETTIE